MLTSTQTPSLADTLIKMIEMNREAINAFSKISGFGSINISIRHHACVKLVVAPEIALNKPEEK